MTRDGLVPAPMEPGAPILHDKSVAYTDNVYVDIHGEIGSVEQGFDEAIAEKLDPVIKEGQKLEKLLQGQMGEPAKKAVVFELTNEKILDAGDKVAAGDKLALESVTMDIPRCPHDLNVRKKSLVNSPRR